MVNYEIETVRDSNIIDHFDIMLDYQYILRITLLVVNPTFNNLKAFFYKGYKRV